MLIKFTSDGDASDKGWSGVYSTGKYFFIKKCYFHYYFVDYIIIIVIIIFTLILSLYII